MTGVMTISSDSRRDAVRGPRSGGLSYRGHTERTVGGRRAELNSELNFLIETEGGAGAEPEREGGAGGVCVCS